MKMKAEIVEWRSEDRQFEGRAYKTRCLVLLDRSEGARLINTVDFMLTEEQAARLPSHDTTTLQGVSVDVGIRDIKATNNGRLRLTGELVAINGKSQETPAVAKK
jgi:hypothetical protein